VIDRYDYDTREAKGRALSAILKVGDRVEVRSLLIGEGHKGTVQAIEPLGFGVDGIWYGWHELERIVAP
jgi:hypothetical protein